MPFDLSTATLLALLLAGCDAGKDDTGSVELDADGDGWTVAEGDCNDGDPTVNAGAEEVVADGVDQDCDGGDTCYLDEDGDGWGSTETVASEDLDCTDAGESTLSTDCDDGDPSIHAGAEEVAADGIDQDCIGGEVCYADGDGDGYGTTATVASADLDCGDPGEAADDTDCDDSRAPDLPLS